MIDTLPPLGMPLGIREMLRKALIGCEGELGAAAGLRQPVDASTSKSAIVYGSGLPVATVGRCSFKPLFSNTQEKAQPTP